MLDFAKSRRLMVDCQLRTFDITDKAVLAAMDEVPREYFVDEAHAPIAYTDRQVTVLGGKAVLMPPMFVGRLIQGLAIKPGEKVLVAGGGTGYGAAILSFMGAAVTLLEDDDQVVAEARRRLGSAGAAGVEVVRGALSAGWTAGAPYDAILLEAGFIKEPKALLNSLASGGRLAGIDMTAGAGKAVLYTHTSAGIGRRLLFDASAPTRQDLVPEPVFQF